MPFDLKYLHPTRDRKGWAIKMLAKKNLQKDVILEIAEAIIPQGILESALRFAFKHREEADMELHFNMAVMGWHRYTIEASKNPIVKKWIDAFVRENQIPRSDERRTIFNLAKVIYVAKNHIKLDLGDPDINRKILYDGTTSEQ